MLTYNSSKHFSFDPILKLLQLLLLSFIILYILWAEMFMQLKFFFVIHYKR
jgi:hypothetical protein